MWKILAAPIIGAVIGYVTNWIAVKMLFRPRHEIRIGGFHLPFTPGVIPKGQPRLAKAVGHAVETELLTVEVMKEMLLSDEMEQKIKDSLDAWVSKEKQSEKTVKDVVCGTMDEESFQEFLLFLNEEGGAFVFKRLMEMEPGKVLSYKVAEVAQEKFANSMIGIMLGGGMMDSIRVMLEEMIDQYLEEHGENYLQRMIAKETDQFQYKTIGELVTKLEENGISIADFVLMIYDKMITEYVDKMMQSLNLSKVVENRINSMKVEEVETLIFAIMKKELGAIVNLGALIGFVLGLVNVAILML